MHSNKDIARLFVLLATFHVSNLAMVSRTFQSEVALILRPADMELVWWDRGSGASRDVSVYTPSGCLRLGDSAVPHFNTNNKPRGFCVEEVVPGSLASPIRMHEIWNDRGSGADWDGSFWWFECPPGYVDLGHATSRSHSSPSLNNYRCIKSTLTTTNGARMKFIWNDRNSGAKRDVSVLGLDCSSPSGTEFNDVIAAYATYNVGSPTRPCVPRSFYKVEYGSPVVSVEIRGITYDLENRSLRGQGTPSGNRATVMNCFPDGVEQTPTKRIAISYELSHSWSWYTEMSIGTTLSVSVNAPFDLGGTEVSVSSTVTNGRSHTSTKTETRTYEATAPITVPPGKKITATVTLQLNKYDVPFVAQAVYIRRDGSRTFGEIPGTYQGFEIADAVFTYGALLAC